MEYTFFVEGIDCANCAAKIEDKLKKETCFSDVKLQFILKKLEVETYEPLAREEVKKRIQGIGESIESTFKLQEQLEVSEEAGCACTKASCKEAKSKDLFWIRFAISVLLLGVGIIADMPVITLVAYGLSGYDVLWRAATNIKKGKVFDEHFLMTVATLAAVAIGELHEAVAVMLFYQVGEYFQRSAVAKSRKAIASLMAIKPEYARVKREGVWIEVPPEAVKVGEIIQVRPGEKIPLDGEIKKGATTVDASMLTGESLPQYKTKGDQVLSAAINLDQLIEIEVTHTLELSTVSKVLEMIEYATTKKTVAEHFITRFAKWYTPIVVFLALGISIVPSLLTGDWQEWVYRGIVFLVISCPCALVVSIPLSFFGGIGAASKEGILVKGSNYLEALSKVDTVVFDKTGTLTKGKFQVAEIQTKEGITKETLLTTLKQVEYYSSHPIARAITSYGEPSPVVQFTAFKEEAGYGIRATLEGKEILAGSSRLLEREGISYDPIDALGTQVYLAVDGVYQGGVVVADTLKEDTKEAIKALKARHIKNLVMLTGDKKEIAQTIGKEVGMDTIYAELLPQDKVKRVEALIEKGHQVAFVGDGINDAPVLTLAHVGIAMGGIGTDAAVEASDVVIMTDSLVKISTAIDLAKQTRAIVIQNIVLALGVKFIVMCLGILGIANMWLAVFADVGVALIAILNAIRVLMRTSHK